MTFNDQRFVKKQNYSHCVKNIRIRSFSGPYFHVFELNRMSYTISLCIQSKCGKIRTRKIPNKDTFHTVEANPQLYSTFDGCVYSFNINENGYVLMKMYYSGYWERN